MRPEPSSLAQPPPAEQDALPQGGVGARRQDVHDVDGLGAAGEAVATHANPSF